MNQHWYHCHTCRMVDGVGVCSVCAKVCHRDHDVTYAKFGSFFCDCGAKDDGACQALVRRPPQPEEDAQPSNRGGRLVGDAVQTRSGLHRHSIDHSVLQQLGFAGMVPMNYVPYRGGLDANLNGGLNDPNGSSTDEVCERRRNLIKQLEPYLGELLQVTASSDLPVAIVDILSTLLPAIDEASKRLSPVGSLQRARRTLHRLHYETKSVLLASESLMIPTLGSQEGAFENVRMSFTGDQGQTIRQLLSAHVLRRVSMMISLCCSRITVKLMFLFYSIFFCSSFDIPGVDVLFVVAAWTQATPGHESRKGQSNRLAIEFSLEAS